MNWGIAMNNQDQSLIFEVSKEGGSATACLSWTSLKQMYQTSLLERISEMSRLSSPKCLSSISCVTIPLYQGAITASILAFIRSVPAR